MNGSINLEQLRKDGSELAPMLKQLPVETKERILDAIQIASIFLRNPENDEKAG